MSVQLLPQGMAVEVIVSAFEHLDSWAMKSAEQFRNAVLGDGMIAINPMINMHETQHAELLTKMLRTVVEEGRMIDFGYIPNDLIKSESQRAREVFESGELLEPFTTWLGVTWWEGGYNGYHVTTVNDHPGNYHVAELYGINMPSIGPLILIYDLMIIEIHGIGETRVRPCDMQYPAGRYETDAEAKARGANSLDPLVTMLRFLADASIEVTHSPAPEKLNKARLQKGKFAIPEHSVVHTKDYVAMIRGHTSNGKRTYQGGHHASPVAHWRRAHMRHLQSGKIIPVRSSKVNWREAEDLRRMFYKPVIKI